jgi:hypothetical protein
MELILILLNKLEEMNMIINKVIIAMTVFSLLLAMSCENTAEKNTKIIVPEEYGPSFNLDEIINNIIYDQTTGPIDAYQIVARSLNVKNIDDPEIVPYPDDYAAAIYKIDDHAEFIEYSKCKGSNLNPKTGYLPHKYFLDWQSTPINPGEMISWEFKYPNMPEVNTTVPMPLDFGNLNSSSTHIDLSQGVELTWENTGSEDLILAASLAFVKANGDLRGGVRSSFIDFIPNSGSYIVTPELLTDLGADSLCINVSFYFGKANIKINKFANDTKQVATVGYVEQTISMPTTNAQ